MDVARKRKEAKTRGSRPFQIGFARAIPEEYRGNLSPRIDWTALDDGSIVGAVAVTSPEALAMRAGIRAELGAAGEIRFFSPDAGQESASEHFPVTTETDFLDNGEPETLWSPSVEGDSIGIEITLPSRGALSTFSIQVVQVSHIFVPTRSLMSGAADTLLFQPDLPPGCDNHVDVQCRTGRFPNNLEDSVARINVVVDGASHTCTGTLLNDTVDGSFIPYFLTANHCVPTGTAARTVEAWWFYQRARCGGAAIDSRFTKTFGGTDILATSITQDMSLLRFRESPPGGLYYSGWSADYVVLATRVFGIHHSAGAPKFYSSGPVVDRGDARVCGLRASDCTTIKDAIAVEWDEGTTEPSSSGSGLFSDARLVGVLSGGGGTCRATVNDYGPFQDFFPRIARWLSPQGRPASSTQILPLVPPASNAARHGFVRIVNHSDRAGTVGIHAVDDAGRRFGPVSVSLQAGAAAQFNSRDLENGNPNKGLSGGVGDGTGSWRLELTSELTFEALGYIRTSDGFVTSMHEVALETGEGSNRYHVPFFNPGSNANQKSLLRLINPGGDGADIVVTGVDGEGRESPSGTVRLHLRAGRARILSARQIEQGGDGLTGRLGDGTGKWRLSVSSDQPLLVMSLLQLPTGHLTNLSRGRQGVAVGTPSKDAPDLVVQAPSVTDPTPGPGESFSLHATVRNGGNGRSAASTTLRYYRSPDSTITTSDTQVGTSSVPGLPASGTSREAVTLTAPSAAGTYYYGACVDAVSGESDTGNNCSSAVRVTVRVGGRFGAIAFDFDVGRPCPGMAAGIALDHRSRKDAVTAARLRCQSDGGRVSECTDQAGAFRDCAALAYGERAGVGCHWFPGDGSTLGAAESAALSGCRGAGFSGCRIWVNRSGQRISGCNRIRE